MRAGGACSRRREQRIAWRAPRGRPSLETPLLTEFRHRASESQPAYPLPTICQRDKSLGFEPELLSTEPLRPPTILIIGKLTRFWCGTIRWREMSLRSIAEVSALIRRHEVSPIHLVRECLECIKQLNPTLNAFITVMAESALVAAGQAEKEIQSGRWRGPLHGIPIGLKDLIDTAGVRTTA